MRLIIIGAGGHGRVVSDIAQQTGRYQQIFFLDDYAQGEAVIGKCSDYMQFKEAETEMYPAFGNNEMRLDWMKKLSDAQIALPRLIHATAYVVSAEQTENT